jgi:DNA-binding protein HU-beta
MIPKEDNRMNQKELMKAITEDVNKKYVEEQKSTKVTESVTTDVMKSFVGVTTEALKRGDQISLAGFGTWKSVHKEASTGRNPATGETIKIPAKNVPKFKAAKALKDALL